LQANAQADTASGNQIIRADLLVDGTFIQTVTSAPWSFNVPQLPAGTHVFAVHVVDNKGNTADTSITLNTKQ